MTHKFETICRSRNLVNLKNVIRVFKPIYYYQKSFLISAKLARLLLYQEAFPCARTQNDTLHVIRSLANFIASLVCQKYQVIALVELIQHNIMSVIRR